MATTRTYGLADDIPEDIPVGCERIALVTDDRTDLAFYQVEKANGDFYVCDSDGDVIDLSSWTLQRVLADVPEGDSDAFFDAIEATASRIVDE